MTRVKWIEDKTYLGTADNGQNVVMAGGAAGVGPMQMLLLGLGGCAAIDVIDITKKQRMQVDGLEVVLSGERAAEIPRKWETVHMHFIVTGADLDEGKLARAIDLSVEKYCSVYATLKGVATITHDFEIRAPVAEKAAA
jgi:putative redox protein